MTGDPAFRETDRHDNDRFLTYVQGYQPPGKLFKLGQARGDSQFLPSSVGATLYGGRTTSIQFRWPDNSYFM